MSRLRPDLGAFGALGDRQAVRRWSRAAEEAAEMPLPELVALRERAGELRSRIERVVHIADGRLTVPRPEQAAPERPLHCDWAWRPELWSGPVTPSGIAGPASGARIGSEAALFHDSERCEVTLRQFRNPGADQRAPYAVATDILSFDGSFLSLAVDLPEAGVRDLQRRHLVRLALRVETERPLELFGRLNIRHGPNTEQLVREFPMDTEEMTVEFDLAYTELNEKRIERAWLDLIFEGPEMNRVVLRDLTLARRPRAEI